jgi:hypothetical protein
VGSRAARRERVPWPIHLDDFMLMGRVDRSSRPSIWIYKHRDSRRELRLDDAGQAYRFTPTPNARSYGRFTTCTIRQAVHLADLPQFVEPIWFDEPPTRPAPWEPASAPDDAPRLRRRHLTLVHGARHAG